MYYSLRDKLAKVSGLGWFAEIKATTVMIINSAKLQIANGTPTSGILASWQSAVAWNSHGMPPSRPLLIISLSAKLSLQDGLLDATKC